MELQRIFSDGTTEKGGSHFGVWGCDTSVRPHHDSYVHGISIGAESFPWHDDRLGGWTPKS